MKTVKNILLTTYTKAIEAGTVTQLKETLRFPDMEQFKKLLHPEGTFYDDYKYDEGVKRLHMLFEKLSTKNFYVELNNGYTADHFPYEHVIEFRCSHFDDFGGSRKPAKKKFGTPSDKSIKEIVFYLAFSYKENKVFSVRIPEKYVGDLCQINSTELSNYRRVKPSKSIKSMPDICSNINELDSSARISIVKQLLVSLFRIKFPELKDLLHPKGVFFVKGNSENTAIELISTFIDFRKAFYRVVVNEGVAIDLPMYEYVLEFRFSHFKPYDKQSQQIDRKFGEPANNSINEILFTVALSFKDDKLISMRHPRQVAPDLKLIASRN